jgi:hypothetical protein
MNPPDRIDEGMRRIEQLIGEIEAAADPALRERVRALVEAVLDVHAGAFRRALEIAGPTVAERLAQDELVGSLLLLHDLHPDLDTPARAAQKDDDAFVPLSRLQQGGAAR